MGFEKFPISVGRWDFEEGDAYGSWCPGIVSLPDIRQLQTMEIKDMKAADKGIDPPLNVDSSMRNERISSLPGDYNFTDMNARNPGVAPTYQVNANWSQIMQQKIEKVEARISRATFEDLFLLLSNTVDVERTAFEVARLEEEKIMMLGSVVNSVNNDVLDDVVEDMFTAANRMGRLPEPPQELQGVDLKIVHTSILDSALRSIGLASIDRMIGFVERVSAGSQSQRAWDKIDIMQSVDEYALGTNAPPRMVRSDEEVQQLDQQRMARNAKAQQLNDAEQESKIAMNLAKAKTNEPNALTQLAESEN